MNIHDFFLIYLGGAVVPIVMIIIIFFTDTTNDVEENDYKILGVILALCSIWPLSAPITIVVLILKKLQKWLKIEFKTND